MGKEGLIEKLKKLFGFIKVKEANLDLITSNYTIPTVLKAKSNTYTFVIDTADTLDANFSDFELNIKDESKEEITAKVKEESLSPEEIKVKSEQDLSLNKRVKEIKNLNITTNVFQQKIDKLQDLGNKIETRSIKVWRRDTIKIHKLKLINRILTVFQGKRLILKFRIKRRRNFFHYSKEEQLNIWKKIISQTKKRPKELELLGLFSNFPVSHASNIKINFKTGDIYFSILEKNSKILKETIIVVRNKEDDKIEIINYGR